MTDTLFTMPIMPASAKEAFTWAPSDEDRRQALWNHRQTLERLAERGGVVWSELAAILEHRPWAKMEMREARSICRRIAERQGPFPAANDQPGLTGAANIDALVVEIHAANVAAGWWSDLATGQRKARNTGELLMLCVSELAEAMEGDRKSLMDDKLPHRPMMEVELADTMIRLLDVVGGRAVRGFGVSVEEMRRWYASPILKGSNVGELLLRITRAFVMAFLDFELASIDAAGFHMAEAYVEIVRLSAYMGYDLWGAMVEKRAFNNIREDHKAEVRAAAGGKAY